MTSDELRASFLRFFEERGHRIEASSSLIPKGDPTLLLTSAGMVQFKSYFMGEVVPPNPRLATCQKCFRTSDIDAVGDAWHCTFFEMLGNFSIGNYFKKEAIAWAWEYVTGVLGIPADHLWVTYYKEGDQEDLEAKQYWLDATKGKLPESRILPLGARYNWWGPAGDEGPCGPCSEIHYSFDPEHMTPDDLTGYSTRAVEIWNLVFTQYYHHKDGRRTPLPAANIDTGMGFERITTVVQGGKNVYDTDIFSPLLDRISVLTGKKYGADTETDRSLRIVAEHSRAITFLIADGVIPSNEGRGYVLRRLLRRAALFGRRLGLDKPFLVDMANVTINRMGVTYTELVKQQDFVRKVIEVEETRFDETLVTGLQLITNIMHESGSRKEISGADAFRLSDTYGFPIDLTKEVAAEGGFTVDVAGYEKEMDKQRERARSSHKFGTVSKSAVGLREQLHIEKTPFVGYEALEKETKIVGILVDDQISDAVNEGQEAGFILAETPFYGEMGGQVGDTGVIHCRGGRFEVTDTVHLPGEIILHRGRVTKGILSTGDMVVAQVDWERRLHIGRNHTATHLLQAALRTVLGEHVQQRGSLVAPERLRFDFSHLSPLTPDEIRKVQRIVNERIRENLPVSAEELPYKQAIASGVTALFDEKYGDVVRVLSIGAPTVSAELCGGTHLKATGEIGYFHIISETSIGTGLRRIEALTGLSAEEYIEKNFSTWRDLGEKLGATLDETPGKVAIALDELDKEKARAQGLERELAKKVVESLVGQAEVVKGVNVLAAHVPPTSPDILREMYDLLKDRLKSAVIVLGTVHEDKPAFIAGVTPDLVAKGYDAGKIIRLVAKVAGGGGGGKPGLAQAGGKDKSKLDEAMQLVKGLI